MIRLFVSDLDGTLLTDEKKVSKTDRIALQKLKNAGIEICFATGRNRVEIEQVMQNIDLPYYQVTQNGAQVYGVEGEMLHSSQFEAQAALNLYRFIQSIYSVPVIIDALFGQTSELKRIIPIEQKSYFSYEDNAIFKHIEELDRKIGSEVIPIKFSYFADVPTLRWLEKEVHIRFPNQFTSFLVDKDCLDFMPLEVNKATGVQLLMDHLGISEQEVVCIGDSENDISMFDIISLSFAMETASSTVQSKASQVVSSVADAADNILYSFKSTINM